MRDSRALLFSSPQPPKWAKEVRKTHQEEKYAKNLCFQVLGLDNRGWVGGALNNRGMIGWGRGCRDGLDIDQLIDWWSREKARLPGIDWQNRLSLTSNPVTRLYHSKRSSFWVFLPADNERRSIFLEVDSVGIVTWSSLCRVRGKRNNRKEERRKSEMLEQVKYTRGRKRRGWGAEEHMVSLQVYF